MKNITRTTAMALVLAASFNVASPLAVEAQAYENQNYKSIVREDSDNYSGDGGITIENRNPVLVFFAGYLVGEVIDGTIKYYSGKAPSDWISWGLGEVESYIKDRFSAGDTIIFVPESGIPQSQLKYGAFTCPGVVIDHSGMCD